MAHIRHDPTSTQKGKISYNSGIVIGIVALAIGEVEYGYNVPSLAFRIQQSIKHNVESMTNYKVAKVDVHIQDVDFPENPAI